MQKSDFDYHLPEQLIAQHPPEQRQDARLMVIHRDTGAIEHRSFTDITEYLSPHDLLIFNDTKVIPARFNGKKRSGGQVEILLERITGKRTALGQIRASKAPKPGTEIVLTSENLIVRVTGRKDRFFELEFPEPGVSEISVQHGQIPLPPYVKRQPDFSDKARYQTVYAASAGAVAAPTAGLHFDLTMLDRLAALDIGREMVTLHVGAGTFQPVQVQDIRDHTMHEEWYSISEQAANRIVRHKKGGGRILAVGTTSVRALESAASRGQVQSGTGETSIFIYPGYDFQIVNSLLTNFHLPGSTLLMLVSALMGHSLMTEAYELAIAEEYRFFSYGDAMLIL